MFSRSFFACLLFCLCLVDAFGQTRVRLFNEKDKNNEIDYIIHADNPTGKKQHVVVIFEDLVGYTPSIRKPPAMNIDIGRSKLFRLKRDELTSTGTFKYRYYTHPGVANPKIKKVEYAIPLRSSKEVLVRHVNAKDPLGQKSSNESFYGFYFRGDLGDTINAARAGRVTKMGGLSTNFIEVSHADGTIGKYSTFLDNSAMVKVGDEILAGSHLALFSKSGVQFNVRYLFYEYKEGVKNTNWYSFKYLIPQFRTENGLEELQNDFSYTVVLNNEMITQEMAKREKKMYLKTNR